MVYAPAKPRKFLDVGQSSKASPVPVMDGRAALLQGARARDKVRQKEGIIPIEKQENRITCLSSAGVDGTGGIARLWQAQELPAGFISSEALHELRRVIG